MNELTEKEKNKLIERTSKYHAYQAVCLWSKGLNKNQEYGSPYWYAEQKMLGHKSFVEDHPYKYDYATSTFILKEQK